jgi:hypothetical protein
VLEVAFSIAALAGFKAEDSAAKRYPIWEYASSPQLPEALEFAAE